MSLWIIVKSYILNDCFISIATCLLLSIVYVGSLYIWKTQEVRDHPSTIKKRFLSVFFMMFISPLFLYLYTKDTALQRVSLWELMGLRMKGLVHALIFPLLLTMALFLGPLTMKFYGSLYKYDTDGGFSFPNFTNLIWLRNYIVAPLSEEFTFRACMLPILLQSFQPTIAIVICPLLFGVAHFHHMIERLKQDWEFKTALFVSLFQFSYTTVFGAYSAFLFVRTGHFASSVLVHAFCNHMGFPNFQELELYKGKTRAIIITSFLGGVILWGFLLQPLTEPTLYSLIS